MNRILKLCLPACLCLLPMLAAAAPKAALQRELWDNGKARHTWTEDENGKKTGEEKFFRPDGSQAVKITYADGMPVSMYTYFPGGALQMSVEYGVDKDGLPVQKGSLVSYRLVGRKSVEELRATDRGGGDFTYINRMSEKGVNTVFESGEHGASWTSFPPLSLSNRPPIKWEAAIDAGGTYTLASSSLPVITVKNGRVTGFSASGPEGKYQGRTMNGRMVITTTAPDGAMTQYRYLPPSAILSGLNLKVPVSKTQTGHGQTVLIPSAPYLELDGVDLFDDKYAGMGRAVISLFTVRDGTYSVGTKERIDESGLYENNELVWKQAYDAQGNIAEVYNPRNVEIETQMPGDEPYVSTEVMPRFGDGDLMSFRVWVMKNLKYPVEAAKSGMQGKVIVTFLVERDGSISNPEVLSSPSGLLGDEVIRVLMSSPKWTPGMQFGQLVRVRYTMPVDFKLGGATGSTTTITRRPLPSGNTPGGSSSDWTF